MIGKRNCFLMLQLKKTVELTQLTIEPPRGKTNNVVSEQVRHKSSCTVSEKG